MHKNERIQSVLKVKFNSLNAELNSICHFLALLGAHSIFHVSRIRFNYQYITYGKHVNILLYTIYFEISLCINHSVLSSLLQVYSCQPFTKQQFQQQNLKQTFIIYSPLIFVFIIYINCSDKEDIFSFNLHLLIN
jgi:amino acid permease